MCGRLNTYARSVAKASQELNVINPDAQIYQRFIRATDRVSIIVEANNIRYIDNAIWWLLLEKDASGLKPSKYTSFNTRYDKLNTPRSAGYQAFRQSRCLIPVKGFGETEFVNKKPLHYVDFTVEEGDYMCLGGLYRQWQFEDNLICSCSVITLPPHDKLTHIHSKASPLIVPKIRYNQWLDPNEQNPKVFDDLLAPHLPHKLYAQHIDKPSSYHPVGQVEVIAAD
ncbi:SOS response-associated peptidase family protein [Thalassotalea sp. LPB0316]|uniref:SOS response-associated peptidase family protein n=1 Tax=Thalassotalea sp. LPB0316 TaxID=2769490 RepID=UPI0018691E5F|nr:SOS response-associated peptidase family protein [Thalassotalea sp. LPB0316]QOL24858.1 SOS response-associated peptidase family protein [Thalassotalea sp. LPB0316]